MGGGCPRSRKPKRAFEHSFFITPSSLLIYRNTCLSVFIFSLAEYLEGEPARKKAQTEAQKAKLEALERKLGISSNDKGKEKDNDPVAGVKRRFDDTEYLEQSRDIVDNVKNAVAAGTFSAFVSLQPYGTLFLT